MNPSALRTFASPVLATALLSFASACAVQLQDIQTREPVRSMNFTASYRSVANCLQQRLGARMQQVAYSDAYVVYDSVKGTAHVDGISHYSITIAPTGEGKGIADVRIVFTPETPEMARERNRRAHAGETMISPVEKYWASIQACVAQAQVRQ